MIAVKLVVVYLLILTSGHRTPTVQETHDTWWECEQSRIRIERQMHVKGECKKVPRVIRDDFRVL